MLADGSIVAVSLDVEDDRMYSVLFNADQITDELVLSRSELYQYEAAMTLLNVLLMSRADCKDVVE